MLGSTIEPKSGCHLNFVTTAVEMRVSCCAQRDPMISKGSQGITLGHVQPRFQLIPSHRCRSRTVAGALLDVHKYTTSEERANFCVEQLKFLARKRRHAAGEGPAMPEESICPKCSGSGELYVKSIIIHLLIT